MRATSVARPRFNGRGRRAAIWYGEQVALDEQPQSGKVEQQYGRGEFYDQETLNGRPILVRFRHLRHHATSCRFEQSCSDDGGTSWELNWVAVDTRTGGVPAP